jgi:predicted transcriptional regulator
MKTVVDTIKVDVGGTQVEKNYDRVEFESADDVMSVLSGSDKLAVQTLLKHLNDGRDFAEREAYFSDHEGSCGIR